MNSKFLMYRKLCLIRNSPSSRCWKMLKSCSTSYCTLESTRLFSLALLNIIRIQDMWNIRWDEIKNPPNFNGSHFPIFFLHGKNAELMEWRGEENRVHHLCIDEFFSLKSTMFYVSSVFIYEFSSTWKSAENFHLARHKMKLCGCGNSRKMWRRITLNIYSLLANIRKDFHFPVLISKIARCFAQWFCQFSHEQIFRLLVCWLSPWT